LDQTITDRQPSPASIVAEGEAVDVLDLADRADDVDSDGVYFVNEIEEFNVSAGVSDAGSDVSFESEDVSDETDSFMQEGFLPDDFIPETIEPTEPFEPGLILSGKPFAEVFNEEFSSEEGFLPNGSFNTVDGFSAAGGFDADDDFDADEDFDSEEEYNADGLDDLYIPDELDMPASPSGPSGHEGTAKWPDDESEDF
jgi:hypothetical protein